jgi:hypothetical protein
LQLNLIIDATTPWGIQLSNMDLQLSIWIYNLALVRYTTLQQWLCNLDDGACRCFTGSYNAVELPQSDHIGASRFTGRRGV